MSLADVLGEQAAAGVPLVAMHAGEIHLADAALVQKLATFEMRLGIARDARLQRHPARLMRDVGRDAERRFGLGSER